MVAEDWAESARENSQFDVIKKELPITAKIYCKSEKRIDIFADNMVYYTAGWCSLDLIYDGG